jgi:hypothetical protein
MPDLHAMPITSETVTWVARVIATLEAIGDPGDIQVRVASTTLGTVLGRDSAGKIQLLLQTALARCELQLPVDARGAFIPAGNPFDAFAAVTKILSAAKNTVMIVDPYADERIFDFLTACEESVTINVLSDHADVKPSLKPASQRWTKQWSPKRPFECRLSSPKVLHDWLIVLDGTSAYSIGQSFKDLTERAHTSIERAHPEIAARKIAAHELIWSTATPL